MSKIRIPVHVRTSRTDRRVASPARASAEVASWEGDHRVPDPEVRDNRSRGEAEQIPGEQAGAEQIARAQAKRCEGQERLLEDVLSIADDLERALAAADERTPIREGVAIAHRGVMHILRQHGVERVDAEAQPFDPRWHEAIDVVSAAQRGVDAGMVVEVLSAGYRRGAQLFRPARVIVAQ